MNSYDLWHNAARGMPALFSYKTWVKYTLHGVLLVERGGNESIQGWDGENPIDNIEQFA